MSIEERVARLEAQQNLATKNDLLDIRRDIAELATGIGEDLRAIRQDISGLRSDIHEIRQLLERPAFRWPWEPIR